MAIIGSGTERAAPDMRLGSRMNPEAMVFVITGTVAGATVGAVTMIASVQGAANLTTLGFLLGTESRSALRKLTVTAGTFI